MKKLLFILLLLPLIGFSQFNPAKYWTVGQLHDTLPDWGDEQVTWVIASGNTGSYFVTLPCSGTLRVDTMAYNSFVTTRTWTLKIKLTDPTGKYSYATRKVLLKKINGVKQKPIMIIP